MWSYKKNSFLAYPFGKHTKVVWYGSTLTMYIIIVKCSCFPICDILYIMLSNKWELSLFQQVGCNKLYNYKVGALCKKGNATFIV